MSLPNLNLLNFEIPQTHNCKYILTSPRSLKACRKARVKPIDLLYKSVNEVEKELGTKEAVQEKYHAYEKERQQKLALCRKLRNDLMLMGMPSRNELQKTSRVKSKINTIFTKCENNLTTIDGKKTEEIEGNTKFSDIKSNEVLPILASSQIVYNDNSGGKDKDIKTEILTPRIVQLNSPSSPDKVTTSSITSSKNPIVTPLPFTNNAIPNKVLEKIPEENSTDTDKFSIDKLDFIENNLKNANMMNIEESVKKEEIPIFKIENRKGVHFGNYNDTLFDKRPSFAQRKKIREKKKLRAMEYERLYNNICAQYADPQYCLRKYENVIENSLERELREQEVHRVQRELEEGLERWQDDVLVMQWLDSLRAQEQVSREIEVKVERLQRRARSKNIVHTMNYNKVKKDEDMKAEVLRRIVEDKERKINNLSKQRQRVICESKTRAQNISELKEQIRNIMTPETFDKKILKCGLQRKVLNTRTMCPKIMHKSHIRLA